MALPGGGIVSVPLASAEGGGNGNNDRSVSPSAGAASTTDAAAAMVPSSSSSASQPQQPPNAAPSGDMLTVNAGEPVTHFNLDQLLEIVHSFQLDTTMAGHEEGEQAHQLNMVLAAAKDLQQKEGRGGVDAAGMIQHCDTTAKDALDAGAAPGTAAAAATAHLLSSSASNLLIPSSAAAPTTALSLPLQSAAAAQSHSCPSSPTETECSSGFSTLRRRSVTLTEKVRSTTPKNNAKKPILSTVPYHHLRISADLISRSLFYFLLELVYTTTI